MHLPRGYSVVITIAESLKYRAETHPIFEFIFLPRIQVRLFVENLTFCQVDNLKIQLKSKTHSAFENTIPSGGKLIVFIIFYL